MLWKSSVLLLVPAVFVAPWAALAQTGNIGPVAVVEVPADGGWIDTGVSVSVRQTIVISAGGLVTGNINDTTVPWSGPDGVGDTNPPGQPCPTCDGNMLIGRVGAGTIFRVGSFAVWDVGLVETGNLELRVNDLNTFDNGGAFLAQVYSFPTNAVPAPEQPALSGLRVDLQSFPNPFGQATSIRFDLLAGASVRVDVIDTAGRRVATLVDGYQGAGLHSVIWDGKDSSDRPVAAGTYFVRISTDEEVLSRKMTVLR